MRKLTYEEFVREYVKTNKKWNFNLFNIVCNKCGSMKVEFNGDIGIDYGYYGDSSIEGTIIVKCHECGNAFTMNSDILGN